MLKRAATGILAEFDLEREKGKLDEQGLRIGENQENSLKNRRKLAESTRGRHYAPISFVCGSSLPEAAVLFPRISLCVGLFLQFEGMQEYV